MNEQIVTNSKEVVGIIQRTLNEVDARLVEHGIRVALIASRMMEVDKTFAVSDRQKICMIAVLHDIGAYKTEEISQLVKFDSGNVYEHSAYGYLFLKHLSPLSDWAEVVLHHHTPWSNPPQIRAELWKAAQIINLADRMEIFSRSIGVWSTVEKMWKELRRCLEEDEKQRFSAEMVELLIEAQERYHILEELQAGRVDIGSVFADCLFTQEECVEYLKMMTYAIDFRSRHTVTHTITTTSISQCCAGYMGLPAERIEQVRYGAMLHDMGKIGIPVEILEFPGKLSGQAMNIMRTHVDITERILAGAVSETVTNIALRHHEKEDGSGYPRGLAGEVMSVDEKIVAVSDIVSALLGTRSYKESYSKDRTVSIIRKLADEGKLSAEVVGAMIDNFDQILREVEENCAPILRNYYVIQEEYVELVERFSKE